MDDRNYTIGEKQWIGVINLNHLVAEKEDRFLEICYIIAYHLLKFHIITEILIVDNSEKGTCFNVDAVAIDNILYHE